MMSRTTIAVAGSAGACALAPTAPAATAAPEQAQDTGLVSVFHGIPGTTVDVFANGDEPLGDFQPGTVTEGGNTTVAAHLSADGKPRLTTFTDDVSKTDAGRSRLTVRHVAAAPAVDVRAGGHPLFTGLANPDEDTALVEAGIVNADVVLAGTETVVVGPAGLDLKEGTTNVVYAWGSAEDQTLALPGQAFGGMDSTPSRSTRAPAARQPPRTRPTGGVPGPRRRHDRGDSRPRRLEPAAGAHAGPRDRDGPRPHTVRVEKTKPEAQEGAVGHVHPSHLVELALGHASGEADVGALRHAASCPRCREELLRLTRVVTAARGAEASDLPVPPPERVWQRIALEVLPETDRVPRLRESSAHGSADERVRGSQRRWTDHAGEGLLGLALAIAVLLLRRWRIRAGSGTDHRGPRLPRAPVVPSTAVHAAVAAADVRTLSESARTWRPVVNGGFKWAGPVRTGCGRRPAPGR